MSDIQDQAWAWLADVTEKAFMADSVSSANIGRALRDGPSLVRSLLAELDAMETERDNAIAALESGA